MSVLLQGLSIPDGNPRTINIYRNGAWCDAYTTENGKAIEVQTPHGRLIDADALELEAQKRLLICNKYGNQFQKPYDVMSAIVLAPTIIEAEDGDNDV